MRCYFHLVSGDVIIPDDEGQTVTNLNHARSEALIAIHDVIISGGTGVDDWSGWNLRVTDATGTVLFSIPLGELLC